MGLARSFFVWALLTALPLGVAAQDGASPDWANKSGGVGVGGNTTLGGVNGIHIRTYVSPQLGLELTFGFRIASESVDDAGSETTFSEAAFQVGLSASYKLAYWQRGHLSAFMGLDVQTLSVTTETEGMPDLEDDATDVALGLGLSGEYFPTQYLSVFLRAGLILNFIGENEIVDDAVQEVPDRDGFAVSLGGQVEALAGFTVWFK